MLWSFEVVRGSTRTCCLSGCSFLTNRLVPFNQVVKEATGVQSPSETAELGSVLTRQQVIDPPAGRNTQNLMRLTPGVTAIGTGQSSIPVNGQINRGSMCMLGGVNSQATFFSNLALNPNHGDHRGVQGPVPQRLGRGQRRRFRASQNPRIKRNQAVQVSNLI